MTKGALSSRWCTCGWVKAFTLELGQKALRRLFNFYSDIDFTFRHIPWTPCGGLTFRCRGLHLDVYDVRTPFADLVQNEIILFYSKIGAYTELHDAAPVIVAETREGLLFAYLIRERALRNRATAAPGSRAGGHEHASSYCAYIAWNAPVVYAL